MAGKGTVVACYGMRRTRAQEGMAQRNGGSSVGSGQCSGSAGSNGASAAGAVRQRGVASSTPALRGSGTWQRGMEERWGRQCEAVTQR